MKTKTLAWTILMGFILMLYSCTNNGHRKKHLKEKVHCYKVHKNYLRTLPNVNFNYENTSDDWVYYYIFYTSSNDGGRSYYSSVSSTPVKTFTSTSWSVSKTDPVTNASREVVQEEEDLEIQTEELPAEVQEMAAENPESLESVETENGEASSDSNAGSESGDSDFTCR